MGGKTFHLDRSESWVKKWLGAVRYFLWSIAPCMCPMYSVSCKCLTTKALLHRSLGAEMRSVDIAHRLVNRQAMQQNITSWQMVQQMMSGWPSALY